MTVSHVLMQGFDIEDEWFLPLTPNKVLLIREKDIYLDRSNQWSSTVNTVLDRSRAE